MTRRDDLSGESVVLAVESVDDAVGWHGRLGRIGDEPRSTADPLGRQSDLPGRLELPGGAADRALHRLGVIRMGDAYAAAGRRLLDGIKDGALPPTWTSGHDDHSPKCSGEKYAHPEHLDARKAAS